jgi:S1-C subfamily serine protease
LAVVKIESDGLPAARFAEQGATRPGQWAIAIGSPFGLDYTVTTGVISAVGRAGLGVNEIEDYVQTDASINPGNSGGPLVNLRGEVVGINTMIAGIGTGIGFAVPGEVGQRVADQLIARGFVQRAWLGVAFQELTPELGAELGVTGPVSSGALINSVVASSPAARAGLKPGDIVLAVDGQPVAEEQDLLRAILRKNVGERTELSVLRKGDRTSVQLTLAQRPDAPRAAARPEPEAPDAMGLSLSSLPADAAKKLGIEAGHGVLVRQVANGSPAERAGLQPRDVIREVDGADVTSARQVAAAFRDGSVLLFVQRGERSFYAVLKRAVD